MRSYKELIVWQKSIDLVEEIYLLTSKFPKTEQFIMISQMRRAALSIPSNIAEGYGRRSRREHNQFFIIAFGSGCELETQLIVAKRLEFINQVQSVKADSVLNEVLRMLNKLTLSSRLPD